jgi:hypothetical protein
MAIAGVKRFFVVLWALLLFMADPASAARIAKMVISSPAQSLGVNQCSDPVSVQAQDSNGNKADVPRNTRLYFDDSSNGLKFFSDAKCDESATNGIVMKSGTSSLNFYFKSSSKGSKTVAVATKKYQDDSQRESIASADPSPSPSVRPSPSPTAIPSASPSPTPSPSDMPTAGRNIPAPLYGVTLDDISNINGEVSSLQQLGVMPTARVVFDASEKPSYYASPLQKLHNVAYIMGQVSDSTDMKKYTPDSYASRAQSYFSALGNQVDVWEIGNEVNGNWLGTGMMPKIEAAYDVVSANQGATAITFFYEGEPTDSKNCISKGNGGDDMFSWITKNFQLDLPVSQRSAESEKVRLNANYILISWYPQQCNNLKPDWTAVYNELAAIFPNSKLGFGEIGTANPQKGSAYEKDLIQDFYPLARNISLPASYIGGYFWWYYAEEMTPINATGLFPVLKQNL